MVVVGIFLLIQFHPIIENNNTVQTLTLKLIALITLFKESVHSLKTIFLKNQLSLPPVN